MSSCGPKAYLGNKFKDHIMFFVCAVIVQYRDGVDHTQKKSLKTNDRGMFADAKLNIIII